MASDETLLYDVILQTRRLFQVLATQGTALHSDLGITASQRAVLEALDQEEPRTVPQIARDKSVTRQHIQALVNELLDKKLVEVLENPYHQRSSLIQRTARGRKAYADMRSREARVLATMTRQIPADDLKATLKTLKRIEEQMLARLLSPTNR